MVSNNIGSHNPNTLSEGKKSGVPESCSLFPHDKQRNKPRRVRNHPPSPTGEEAEKKNFEFYWSEAEHASSMYGWD